MTKGSGTVDISIAPAEHIHTSEPPIAAQEVAAALPLEPEPTHAVHWLLGLPVDCVDIQQSQVIIRQAIATREQLVFATPNVNFLAEASRDSNFREAILRTNLSLVDGMPLVWLGRMLGIPFPGRVAGSTLIEHLLADRHRPAIKVFFLGGAPGVAEAASAAVNATNGGLRAVGALDPGNGSVEELSRPEIIAAINASGAEMLIVSLGARKGHLWIEQNRGVLEPPVISHLGAVVNFMAGRLSRAPAFLQNVGLEWTWRIYQEPTLMKRYAKDGVFLIGQFFAAACPLMLGRIRASLSRQELSVEVTTQRGHRHIRISGALTANNVVRLNEILLDSASEALLIDVSGLTYVDTRGLGYLYNVGHRCKNTGQTIQVAGTPSGSLWSQHRTLPLVSIPVHLPLDETHRSRTKAQAVNGD